jgi:hypothetical protein
MHEQLRPAAVHEQLRAAAAVHEQLWSAADVYEQLRSAADVRDELQSADAAGRGSEPGAAGSG